MPIDGMPSQSFHVLHHDQQRLGHGQPRNLSLCHLLQRVHGVHGVGPLGWYSNPTIEFVHLGCAAPDEACGL
eukprot:12742800-Heterocapsa_arctica.AAC.1